MSYPEQGSPVTDDDESQATQSDLHALCEAWIWWRVEHSMRGPVLSFKFGPLPSGRRALRQPEHPFAASALVALQVAYSCQPDALDKQVFDLYYLARVRPVKAAAAYLGIGHRQFYRVLESFRVRLEASGKAFIENGDRVSFLRDPCPDESFVNEKSVSS